MHQSKHQKCIIISIFYLFSLDKNLKYHNKKKVKLFRDHHQCAQSYFCSVSEAIEGLALPLEGVHHVGGHDGLPLGVLGVGHGVPHHVLQEHAQDSSDLKIWKCF